MHIERTIDLEAPASVVWAVMADVEQWHTWTDSIDSVVVAGAPSAAGSGDAVGIGSSAVVRQPGFPAATWTVTEWEPGRSFTWESRAPGVHSVGEHSVEAVGESACRATLAIHQTGALAWVLGLLAGRRSRRYVDMEAAGLKARSEVRVP